MSANHTPGPWRQQREVQGGRTIYRVYRKHGRFACTAECQPHTVPNEGIQQANARLIAAAPELLDAVRTMTDEIEKSPSGTVSVGTFDRAREAIADAEGTTA